MHDLNSIKRLLPHREPFLFLDRLEEVDSPRKGRGIFNLKLPDLTNRPLFNPYLLLIEFAAQTSAYVSAYSSSLQDPSLDKQGYLVTIKDFTVKNTVEFDKEIMEFHADVTLLKNYKTLYRYFFSVGKYIEGELEFIGNK